MNSNQKAHVILDTALNSTSAYAKAQARKLLAYDTNTPGWWSSVDELREYMDKEVGTLGGEVWDGKLTGPNNYMRVPQVVPHKGMLGFGVEGSETAVVQSAGQFPGILLIAGATFGAAYGVARYSHVEKKPALILAGVAAAINLALTFFLTRQCTKVSTTKVAVATTASGTVV